MPICESESIECGGRGKKIAATPAEAFTYKLDLVNDFRVCKKETNQLFG